jgi:hypothetical protein
MGKDYDKHEVQHAFLLEYLLVMVARRDWHGVSDAANDLRVLEAEQKNLTSERSIQISDTIAAKSSQP